MKIYLDSCCLNRPFDDLRADVVRMEAEAVVSIIDRCEDGEWKFYSSDVLLDELERNPHLDRKQKAFILYRSAKGHIDITADIVARAKQLEKAKIGPYDALHLASAEAGTIDVFLTTDRKLINAAKRADVKVKVMNPLIWLTEVLYDE